MYVSRYHPVYVVCGVDDSSVDAVDDSSVDDSSVDDSSVDDSSVYAVDGIKA